MKTKFIFLSAVLTFTVGLLNAQGPFFAGFGAGYSVGISRSIIGYNSENNSVANTYFEEGVKGSYGKGVNVNVYGGYMINNVIGLELAANYLQGGMYTFTRNEIHNNYSSLTTDEAHLTSFRLIPCIRLGYGENDLRFYSRVALAFGLKNTLIYHTEEQINHPAGTDFREETFVYRGGNYIGFTGAFGLTYNLSEHIAIYGELTRYFVTWGATEGEYTLVTDDGVDQLGGMTTSEKHYEYVDRIDQTMNNNTGEPTKVLRTYVPLNSLGVNAGLHFTF